MDYAIAVDRLLPGAKWLRAESYAELVTTWGDAQPVPSDAALIAAYADWQAEQVIQVAQDVVQLGAKTQATTIPNFAHWTEQQGLDWIAANIGDTPINAVTNLADAKLLMKKQAVALEALWRVAKAFLNHTWPDLENTE